MDPSPPGAPAHLAWWSAPALQELRRWVKWAGGAGRREGVHMVHTFEEVRTPTPAEPNKAAPDFGGPSCMLKTTPNAPNLDHAKK